MKKILCVFSLVFTLSIAHAQKKQNVYFFKDNGKEVAIKDSADFIRVIQEPDSGDVNFPLQEFYANGKRKTLGRVSSFEPRLVLEGAILRYNKLGKRISVTTYERGAPIGIGYHYFGDGTLNEKIEYVKYSAAVNQMVGIDAEMNGGIFNQGNKLIYLADSLGVVHINEGNGHLKQVTRLAKENERIEEGDYKDGVKNGIWLGEETGNGLTYTETYEMGKLISGESMKNGEKYTYKSTMEPPQFKGGALAWSNYIKNTLKYPADAVRMGVMGVVLTNFTVDKDGTISDIDIVRSVYPSLDEEAKRVLLRSPKWVPAKMRGVPVRIRFNQPFNYKL